MKHLLQKLEEFGCHGINLGDVGLFIEHADTDEEEEELWVEINEIFDDNEGGEWIPLDCFFLPTKDYTDKEIKDIFIEKLIKQEIVIDNSDLVVNGYTKSKEKN